MPSCSPQRSPVEPQPALTVSTTDVKSESRVVKSATTSISQVAANGDSSASAVKPVTPTAAKIQNTASNVKNTVIDAPNRAIPLAGTGFAMPEFTEGAHTAEAEAGAQGAATAITCVPPADFDKWMTEQLAVMNQECKALDQIVEALSDDESDFADDASDCSNDGITDEQYGLAPGTIAALRQPLSESCKWMTELFPLSSPLDSPPSLRPSIQAEAAIKSKETIKDMTNKESNNVSISSVSTSNADANSKISNSPTPALPEKSTSATAASITSATPAVVTKLSAPPSAGALRTNTSISSSSSSTSVSSSATSSATTAVTPPLFTSIPGLNINNVMTQNPIGNCNVAVARGSAAQASREGTHSGSRAMAVGPRHSNQRHQPPSSAVEILTREAMAKKSGGNIMGGSMIGNSMMGKMMPNAISMSGASCATARALAAGVRTLPTKNISHIANSTSTPSDANGVARFGGRPGVRPIGKQGLYNVRQAGGDGAVTPANKNRPNHARRGSNGSDGTQRNGTSSNAANSATPGNNAQTGSNRANNGAEPSSRKVSAWKMGVMMKHGVTIKNKEQEVQRAALTTIECNANLADSLAKNRSKSAGGAGGRFSGKRPRGALNASLNASAHVKNMLAQKVANAGGDTINGNKNGNTKSDVTAKNQMNRTLDTTPRRSHNTADTTPRRAPPNASAKLHSNAKLSSNRVTANRPASPAFGSSVPATRMNAAGRMNSRTPPPPAPNFGFRPSSRAGVSGSNTTNGNTVNAVNSTSGSANTTGVKTLNSTQLAANHGGPSRKSFGKSSFNQSMNTGGFSGGRSGKVVISPPKSRGLKEQMSATAGGQPRTITPNRTTGARGSVTPSRRQVLEQRAVDQRGIDRRADRNTDQTKTKLQQSDIGQRFLDSGHRRTSADERRRHDEMMEGYRQSLTGVVGLTGDRNGERGSVDRNVAGDRNATMKRSMKASSRDLSRENYGVRRAKKVVERRDSGGGL